MIISSSFFFYHVNFIIDQLSVMQNNFKYWVSFIGIINKYALLSELDKGIIQSWPMGALPSQTLNLLTILFSMLFWWRSENSATVQDSMAFLPIMRKGHFGEWLWCSALKIKTIFLVITSNHHFCKFECTSSNGLIFMCIYRKTWTTLLHYPYYIGKDELYCILDGEGESWGNNKKFLTSQQIQ